MMNGKGKKSYARHPKQELYLAFSLSRHLPLNHWAAVLDPSQDKVRLYLVTLVERPEDISSMSQLILT